MLRRWSDRLRMTFAVLLLGVEGATPNLRSARPLVQQRAKLECEGGPHTMTNVPRGYGGGNAYDIWASVSELRK